MHLGLPSQDPARGLYEEDFYSWTQAQSGFLRSGQFAKIDVVNLVEEIESLGRSQLAALRSSYRLIALHLLKLSFQPTHSSTSWMATIVRERGNVEDLLDDNPGLRPKRAESLAKAYPKARREAAIETQLALATFPRDCPFTLAEIEDHDFWP